MANIKFSQFTSSGYAATIQLVGYDTATNANIKMSISSIVGGTGVANQLAVWNGANTLNGNANLTWVLGSPNTLSIGGVISINTSGQAYSFSTRYGTNSLGSNIWIGNGGSNSIGVLGQTFNGSNNVAVGHNAMFSATTAYQCVAVGSGALSANTTGNTNVAVGYNALVQNTTGSGNLAVGYSTLLSNTTGVNNVAVGGNALNANIAGSSQVAVGAGALQAYNTSGFQNTAIGRSAGSQLLTGNQNIFIGYDCANLTSASTNFTTSNGGIYIGSSVRAAGNSAVNEIVIGYGQTGAGSNTTVIGSPTNTLTSIRGEVRPSDIFNLGLAATKILVADPVSNNIKFRTAAEIKSDLGLGSSVTSTGSTNYVPKFTSSTNIGNSLIQDNGAQLGYNAAATGLYAHNFGSVGFITNFDLGTDGKIRLGSSFASDADGYISAPFGNFVVGTNIYYVQPNWVYGKNGYGAYIQMEAVTGTISFIRAANNTGGSGVVATPVSSGTFWNTGNFSLNKASDAGWKLDVGATSNGVRITGAGTTSATIGFRVENSGATTNMVILDNGNIGVREANPSARMHILTGGATTSSIGLRVRNSADTVDIIGTYGTTQVVINSTSGLLSTSAQLQIDSTTRGLLIPRMTDAQITAIATPANGLMAYSTTQNVIAFYDGTGWRKVNHAAL